MKGNAQASAPANMMTNNKTFKTLRILAVAVVFAVAGASIDVHYEWPVRVPGDPSSSLHTFRDSVGVGHGWIFYSSDDIFAYDGLVPGFGCSIHPPIMRQPFGYGGWTDFGILGIAPWFLAAGVVFLRFLRAGLRRRADKEGRESIKL